MPLYIRIGLAVAAALAVSFAATPVVKWFARRVGAMDVPGDARRIHKTPIPRLGGLAIFVGFVISAILLADITGQIKGVFIGAVIIVIVGAVDDIKPLPALFKLLVQVIAALIAVYFGVVIDTFANPFVFGSSAYIHLNALSIPITVIWIVAITNSVNLIDGLDGLSVGVSTISSIVMIILSVMVSDTNVAVIMAALAGACLGFIPYNFNPAKIFMGDAGALFLGYMLATMSILGLFKFYAAVSFVAPILMLALPLFDTSFAFLRRLLKGKKPWMPDRGHLHHRLLDMGFSQKQAVLLLYVISGVLGFAAIIVAMSDDASALILVACIIIVAAVVYFILKRKRRGAPVSQNAEFEAPDSVQYVSSGNPEKNPDIGSQESKRTS